MNSKQGQQLSETERRWDGGQILTDEELKFLLNGFEFLSCYHLHGAPILVGPYRQRVESVRRMIEARKAK